MALVYKDMARMQTEEKLQSQNC